MMSVLYSYVRLGRRQVNILCQVWECEEILTACYTLHETHISQNPDDGGSLASPCQTPD